MTTNIIILCILVVVIAFLAVSEIALVSLNDSKLRLLADSGDKKAKKLYALLSKPSRFLITIKVGITLAGFLVCVIVYETFSAELIYYMTKLRLPISSDVVKTCSFLVVTFTLTYLILVFGELIPRRLAELRVDFISRLVITPLSFISSLLSPFVKFVTFTLDIVTTVLGLDQTNEKTNVTEEEIRMLIDIGEEKGTIQDYEKTMINNIFEFDNKTVVNVMTHRTNIVAIPINLSLEETLKLVDLEKYTRFPVYGSTIDDIVGILHVKDLIQFIVNSRGSEFNLKNMIREPYLTLPTTRIDDLFKRMKNKNIFMAIVLDEYGGINGLVTIEDLVEQIVGNIFDEYDEPYLVDEIKELEQNTFLISGATNLLDVNERLNIDLPIEDIQTLGGFLTNQLGYLPKEDENSTIKYNNTTFTINEIDNFRVVTVKAIVDTTFGDLESLE